MIATPAFLTVTLPGDIETPTVSMTLSPTPNHHGHLQYLPNTVDISHPFAGMTTSKIKRLSWHKAAIPQIVSAILDKPDNADIAKISHIQSYRNQRKGRKTAATAVQQPSDKHLEHAALVYQLARLARDTTIIAVDRTFQISHHDAQRWVRLAKSKGLL